MQELKTIAIGEKQIKEVQDMSSKLRDEKLRKKAYVNFTGTLFAIEFLQKMGLRTNSQRSIFKCSKLYTDFEIADIYCNSHMLFVITTYGSDKIEIPTLHKEFDILPEGYIVVDLQDGMREAEIKGVIEVEDLENAKVSGEYYTLNFKDTKPIDEFLPKVKKYAGIKPSVGKHLDCMNLFVPYIENKLNKLEKKSLIEHILSCETCKKRLIETIEFDENAKTLKEQGIILSKEDLKSKENFINSLNKGENDDSLVKGAIDVIYQGKEFAKLKDEAFKFRPDISSKAKKLAMTAFLVVATLIILVVFAFNIPMDKTSTQKNVQGEIAENVRENEYENFNMDFDFKIPTIKKPGKYTTISKVSWEISSDLTKEEQKNFLQQAGKSIRLNLQNDLLLSNEATVNSKIKFDIRYFRDGSIENISIVESSGSRAVDEIIKQSIQNTLEYMRPPKGSFVGKKNAITLIINF